MKILSILFRLLLLSEFEYHLLVEILSDIWSRERPGKY